MMKFMFSVALALAASVAFGGVLDSAWIQGTTDKSPLFYKPGEKMVFTLTPQGLDGAVPADEYFLDWSRAGVDIDTLRTEPEPADFDAFWAKQYKRLDLVSIKSDRIEIKCSNPQARLYAVRIDCAG